LDTTRGGAWEVSVASTGWGMKLRFAEWVARGIQASRFGWESERRKGMGWLPDWDRLVLTDFSIRGVGPVGGMLDLELGLLWMWEFDWDAFV
jgi:hypothetical protein